MPSNKLLPALLLTATAWLTGCNTVPSDASACPRIVEYPQTFQKRMAAEVGALPADSAVLRAIIDYGRLRDEIRACR